MPTEDLDYWKNHQDGDPVPEGWQDPPEEPRWGGTGPSDRNAEPLPPTVQDEEDAANADS